jgi:predicted chitinase
VNVDTLVAAMPGLDRGRATVYQPLNDAAMREFGITSTLRAWMWLAQVGHESASLRYFEEIADGSAYEGRKDLGNTQPGDGRRFKGRGPIQITGRANYTAAAAALKLDLVGQPQLAAQPQHAFRVSAWWWSAHGLNGISDSGDVTAATRRINGGLNGLADRQARYARVKALGATAVLPGGAPAPPSPSDENLIASAVAGGVLHEFVATPDAVFVTWQAGGKWSGAGRGGGYPAGVRHFCAAPKGHKLTAIAAVAAYGLFYVFARTEDGASWITWQARGKWSGEGGGWMAGLSHFAARP